MRLSLSKFSSIFLEGKQDQKPSPVKIGHRIGNNNTREKKASVPVGDGSWKCIPKINSGEENVVALGILPLVTSEHEFSEVFNRKGQVCTRASEYFG